MHDVAAVRRTQWLIQCNRSYLSVITELDKISIPIWGLQWLCESLHQRLIR